MRFSAFSDCGCCQRNCDASYRYVREQCVYVAVWRMQTWARPTVWIGKLVGQLASDAGWLHRCFGFARDNI